MSQENVEIVRRYYEATNRGDDQAVERMLAPDFVAAASLREAWETLIIEPEELIPVGDRVVAVVLNRARGKSSGADVEARTGQLWTLRDGLIVRFEYFGTKEEALEAVGLSE